nr:RHS repeat-associated core domain-containing protein [Actinospica acidiphila]
MPVALPAGRATGVRCSGPSALSTTRASNAHVGGATGLPRSTPTDAAPRPTRYAGAYADPTGLYKMGHRYDAPLGRFTQPDPSGQETNPYLYASGDPINCGTTRRWTACSRPTT